MDTDRSRKLAGFLVAACAIGTACGGGGGSSRPITPTSPAPSPAPSTPAYRWSIAGQVVATGSGQPIPEASIAPSWGLAPVNADAQGSYLLGDFVNPPTDPYRVDISAPGYVTHNMWVQWQRGPRTGVSLDAIADRAPFSMEFYRQLVRGTYDEPGAPWPVLRWTSAPSFYVRTVDQNGRAIEPEVIAVTIDAIRRAVPAWTAGRFAAVVVETGVEVRPPTPGWITVDIRRDPEEETVCGTSDIGQSPGSIILNDDVCACGSVKIPGDVTLHEVGHAMGFFHVSDSRSIMYPFEAGDCPPGELSPAEMYHAAIAYSRPRGNTDPDQDPDTSSTPVIAPRRVR
jgi:hypothetical protein